MQKINLNQNHNRVDNDKNEDDILDVYKRNEPHLLIIYI